MTTQNQLSDKSNQNTNRFKALEAKVSLLKSKYEALISGHSSQKISDQQKEDAKVVLNRLVEIHKQIKENNFNVGVVGTFNTGKSTFLNALLGQKVLSTKILPETASITAIKELKDATEPYAVVHFFNQAEWDDNRQNAEQLKLSEPTILESIQEIESKVGNKLSQYITKDGRQEKCVLDQIFLYTTAKEGNLSPLVKIVEVFLPNEFCQEKITLIDTPGLNDPNKLRELVTESYLENIDLLIMLFPAEQAFTDFDHKFIKTQLIKGRINKTFFVMNKIDNLNSDDDDADIKETVEKIKKWLTAQIQKTFKSFEESYPNRKNNIPNHIEVFELSAQQAFLNKVPSNKKATWSLEESKFPKFEKRLKNFLLEGEKYEALIDIIDQKIKVILEERLDALNSSFLSLDSNVDTLKKEVDDFRNQKESIEKEVKITTKKIDEDFNKFKNKDRKKSIEYAISQTKSHIEVIARSQLDQYLRHADTGKEAAEGFEYWCKNQLSAQVKSVINEELTFVMQDTKLALEDDYQELMNNIEAYYQELEEHTDTNMSLDITLNAESEGAGFFETVAVGASVLLGPIAIVAAVIYTLFRMFGESDSERESYMKKIREAFETQVLPSIRKSLDQASSHLQQNIEKIVNDMSQQINQQIYLPIDELKNKRAAKEQQLNETILLLQKSQTDRDQKKQELLQEINIIKGLL